MSRQRSQFTREHGLVQRKQDQREVRLVAVLRQQRPQSAEEEPGVDIARLRNVEVLRRAARNLLNGGAAARASAEVDRGAEGSVIEEQPGDGGGDEIDRDDVQHRIGKAGHGAPQAAGIDLQRPIQHLEAGRDAGAGIAHDDAGPQDDAGDGTETRADQGLGFGFGLFVCIAVALTDDEFAFAHEARAIAGHVGRADVGQAPQARRSGGEIKDAAGALDVDAPGFVERVIETHRGSAVDHAGGLPGQTLPGGGVQAAVGLADISGKNLDALPLRRGYEQVGALPARLAGFVTDQQRQGGLRMTVQQLAHQPRAEKAGGASDENEFFVVHSGTDLSARTTERPGQRGPSSAQARYTVMQHYRARGGVGIPTGRFRVQT